MKCGLSICEYAYIDTHIHSHFSDGVSSINDIINRIPVNSLISITDHNTFGTEFKSYISDNVSVIKGVETRLYGKPDLLWYFTDSIPNSALDFIHKIDDADRRVYMSFVKQVITEINYNFSSTDLFDEYRNKLHLPDAYNFNNRDILKILEIIYENSKICSVEEFNQCYRPVLRNRLGEFIRFSHKIKPDNFYKKILAMSDTEFINYLSSIGGIAVFAHPYCTFRRKKKGNADYSEFFRWLCPYVEQGVRNIEFSCKDLGLLLNDGLNPQPFFRLIAQLTENNFWGSDCHDEYDSELISSNFSLISRYIYM